MSTKKVKIGIDEFTYVIEENYTYIYNADDEHIIQLRWAVSSDQEVIAAAYGYGAGFHKGRAIGGDEKIADIRNVLGI